MLISACCQGGTRHHCRWTAWKAIGAVRVVVRLAVKFEASSASFFVLVGSVR